MHHLTGNIVAVNDCEEEQEVVVDEEEEQKERDGPRLDLCARGRSFAAGGAVPPTERLRRRWWVKEATSRTSTTSSATNVPQNVLLNANCKKNYCYYELLIEWSWCGHTARGGEGKRSRERDRERERRRRQRNEMLLLLLQLRHVACTLKQMVGPEMLLWLMYSMIRH